MQTPLNFALNCNLLEPDVKAQVKFSTVTSTVANTLTSTVGREKQGPSLPSIFSRRDSSSGYSSRNQAPTLGQANLPRGGPQRPVAARSAVDAWPELRGAGHGPHQRFYYQALANKYRHVLEPILRHTAQ